MIMNCWKVFGLRVRHGRNSFGVKTLNFAFGGMRNPIVNRGGDRFSFNLIDNGVLTSCNFKLERGRFFELISSITCAY